MAAPPYIFHITSCSNMVLMENYITMMEKEQSLSLKIQYNTKYNYVLFYTTCKINPVIKHMLVLSTNTLTSGRRFKVFLFIILYSLKAHDRK